jgi:hypothetical protein
MTNSNVHVLHRHHAHGARCAVGVGVHHQIQAGEVADDQVGKVAKPQIIGLPLGWTARRDNR